MNKIKSIAEQNKTSELKIRSIILAILLTLLLAMSNSYLALKLGILTSASIPAAIISMGLLRFFKDSTIVENNLVQTAASAGEAVAGGIVYTIPALIIIQYWNHFDYFTNFLIAATGGILGVLFSIPLRRILVNEPLLPFPEGRAIAEVLKFSAGNVGIREIILGGSVGAILEMLQVGFKIIASHWNYWFVVKRSLFVVGAGFSTTMIGAGYLIGYEMALSIFLGAVIAWGIAMPLISHHFPAIILHYPPQQAADLLWNSQIRYIGIGAMLCAGVWTFLKLLKPLIKSIALSLYAFTKQHTPQVVPQTDKDIPIPLILGGVFVIAIVLLVFFKTLLPFQLTGIEQQYIPKLILFTVGYVLIIGFLFSVITGYLSGMVGVTASPGSAVIIAGMLFAAWILLTLLHHLVTIPLTNKQIQAAEAITIIIGSVITGIAAIANDNTQDLKVGQLVGATPWKQQVMLLLGVVVSALIIPPIMQILFDVYGIAGVMPHPGMDPSQSLPAPTAALIAAITEAVFRSTLPWTMMSIGAGIIGLLLLVNRFSRISYFFRLSFLGIAIGIYLPLSSSVPLFIGGMISLFTQIYLNKIPKTTEEKIKRKQNGVLIACGLVAGSTIIDVFLAIPFSLLHSPDALKLLSDAWYPYEVILGILSTLVLSFWMQQRVCKSAVI